MLIVCREINQRLTQRVACKKEIHISQFDTSTTSLTVHRSAFRVAHSRLDCSARKRKDVRLGIAFCGPLQLIYLVNSISVQFFRELTSPLLSRPVAVLIA